MSRPTSRCCASTSANSAPSLEQTERFARQRRIAYLRGLTDVSFEEFTLRALRLAGLVK